jgi:hypothetical protein
VLLFWSNDPEAEAPGVAWVQKTKLPLSGTLVSGAHHAGGASPLQ